MAATVSSMTQIPPEGAPEHVSLADYLPYQLATSSTAVSRLIARAYEDSFGLTIPQWRLMSVLAEGDLTQHTAVTRTAMDKVRVSRAAQELVVRRLVARTTVGLGSPLAHPGADGRRPPPVRRDRCPWPWPMRRPCWRAWRPTKWRCSSACWAISKSPPSQLTGGETPAPPS
jgi:hypothetical protein